MRLNKMILALGLSILSVSCTRATDGEKVRLVIPFNGSSSSLAAGDMLTFAVVNIQVPGRPAIVREFEFDSNPVPWGTPVDLVVPNVPSGPGILIQFMGVFDTAAGASFLLTYGDALVTVNKGTTLVNLTATPAGTATKEGRVAGRYFNSSTSGPTGTMVTYFQPPDLTKPRMAVTKNNMVSGWFNTLVLDNIAMTHVMIESGITIFSGLTIGHPALATGNHVLRMDSASYYEREEKNSVTQVRPRVSGAYYLGFFKDANGPASFAPYQVCYASSYTEGMPGWYGVYANTTLSSPLAYAMSAGPGVGLYPSAGGFAATYSGWATNLNCDPTTGTQLSFYHHRMANEGEESFAGMRPPFRLVEPFANHGGYLSVNYQGGSVPMMQLKWAYLNGAAPFASGSEVTGADVLYKISTSGSTTGGGRDDSCGYYMDQGYSVLGSVTTSSGLYSFTSSTQTPLSNNNYYNYQFAVCAYGMKNGQKVYIGEPIASSCTGGCGALEHYGWGTQSLTLAGGGAEANMGLHYARATAVDAATSEYYTVLSLSSNGIPEEFTAGDVGSEILLTVLGTGASDDCGTWQGQAIQPGLKAFVRAFDATSTSMKINKGTFADVLSNTYLWQDTSTSNFCFVQATKVLHYRSLTLTGSIWPSALNYAGGGGGILPLRVASELNISGGVSISVAATGYPSGSAGYAGAGHRGDSAISVVSGNSGGAYSSFGSGGGAGPTADGGVGFGALTLPDAGAGGMAPIGSNSGGGDFMALPGGGGGGAGGTGGGILFVAARYTNASSGSALNAFGNMGASGNYGGGGGGSIVLVGERLTGPLNFDASGAAATGGTTGAGGGGGGLITKYICTDSGTGSSFVNGGVGPVAANTTYGAKNGQIFTPSGGWNPGCR